MPDVHVRLNRNLFSADAYELQFLEALAEIVAEQMSCDDDEGDYLQLDPETQIDPYTTYYGVTTDRVLKIVLIDLSAFDYLARMDDIEARIANIANSAKALLPESISVQITFHPVGEKCWFVAT